MKHRHQGLVSGRTTLKNRNTLEGPRRGRELPSRMRRHNRLRCGKVIRVVSAETKIRAGIGTRRERLQEGGLHDAIFVVAALRPRVGEEHKNPFQHDMRRKSRNELFRLGLHKGEIHELCAVALAQRALHAVAEEVDTKAKFSRMRRGVIGEVVSMARADLQCDACVRGEQFSQGGLQGLAACGAMKDELGGAGGIVHDAPV